MSNTEIGTDSSNALAAETSDHPTSALAVRAFRIYFIGTVLAMNALRLGAVAQGLLMWELTGSTLSLGGVAAATAIPMVLVNIFGGVLADRHEAKFLLGGSSLIRALISAAMRRICEPEIPAAREPRRGGAPSSAAVKKVSRSWAGE